MIKLHFGHDAYLRIPELFRAGSREVYQMQLFANSTRLTDRNL